MYEAVFPELSIPLGIKWNQMPKCLLTPVMCKIESVKKLSMETVATELIADFCVEIAGGTSDWKELH